MAYTSSVDIILEGNTENTFNRRFYFCIGAIPTRYDIIDIDNVQYQITQIIWKAISPGYTEIRPTIFIVKKVSMNIIPCD